MSKKMNQIKDSLTKEIGYQSHQEYIEEINGNYYCAERLENFYDEVAERYAQSQTQELQEQNAELVEFIRNHHRYLRLDDQSKAKELLTKYNHLNKKF